jgi:hypothetical protein
MQYHVHGMCLCEIASARACSALINSACPATWPRSRPACSYEWWWQDEAYSGQVQPLGHSVQRGCYPYNQQIARKGTWAVESLQVCGSLPRWPCLPLTSLVV